MSEFTPGAPGSPPTERVADAPAGVEPVGASADDDEQLTRAELEAELATLRAALEVALSVGRPA